jgi:UDP-GlcNAc3NAcA epimerase
MLRTMYCCDISNSAPPPPKEPSEFALTTIHRAAITSDARALRSVLEALGALEMPVNFAVHPLTRLALVLFELMQSIPPSVSIRPPLGYLEAIAAVRDAAVVITDSGGLQREAYWLGTPCVTLRTQTEWVETVECGANTMVQPLLAREALLSVVREQRRARKVGAWPTDAYGGGDAAERVVAAVASYFQDLDRLGCA